MVYLNIGNVSRLYVQHALCALRTKHERYVRIPIIKFKHAFLAYHHALAVLDIVCHQCKICSTIAGWRRKACLGNRSSGFTML